MSDSTGHCSTAAVRIQGQVHLLKRILHERIGPISDTTVLSRAVELLHDILYALNRPIQNAVLESELEFFTDSLTYMGQDSLIRALEKYLEELKSKTSRTSTAAGQTDGTQPPATALWSPQSWNQFQAGTTHGSGAGAAASSAWSHSLPPAGWAGSGMQMQGQGEPNPAMGG